jgi:hypothetical protein
LTINAPTYTTTPYTCTETVTYSVEKQDGTAKPDYVTIDTGVTPKVVSIQTSDTALSGVLYLRIKITRN